jgi:hypothetical protein
VAATSIRSSLAGGRWTTCAARLEDYVPLPAAADPDELLGDSVAMAKAWRVARQEELGGFTDTEEDRSTFEELWRGFVDARRDLVATLRLEKYEEAKRAAHARRPSPRAV